MEQQLYKVKVGMLADIPQKGSRRVQTPMGEVALFRTANDTVHALKNECPHKKGPLSEGIIHGSKVTCPLHNWVIDMATGEAEGPDVGCTPVIPAFLEGDEIYLAFEEDYKASA